MKYKKIVVPNFKFKDALGDFDIKNVTVLVSSEVSEANFDISRDEYDISGDEIARIHRLAAHMFFDENHLRILKKEKTLTPTEILGIKTFLQCNGPQLAQLLGLDKSQISKLLSGAHPIRPTTTILLFQHFKRELEESGSTKLLLDQIETQESCAKKDLQIPVLETADWFVKKFYALEEQDPLTPLKLQKLLYYGQGVAISLGFRLFSAPIHAWKHGPVIEVVYEKYKNFGRSQIVPETNSPVESVEENEHARTICEHVFQSYGRLLATTLSQKTHLEAPWRDTYKEGQTIEIPFSKLEEYFQKVSA